MWTESSCIEIFLKEANFWTKRGYENTRYNMNACTRNIIANAISNEKIRDYVQKNGTFKEWYPPHTVEFVVRTPFKGVWEDMNGVSLLIEASNSEVTHDFKAWVWEAYLDRNRWWDKSFDKQFPVEEISN
jgi:hypothetical protein